MENHKGTLAVKDSCHGKVCMAPSGPSPGVNERMVKGRYAKVKRIEEK